MRVLWIVNTIFPYPSQKIGQPTNVFGGWLLGLSDQLRKIENVELGIATVYSGKKIIDFNDGKITYYLIPGAPSIKYNHKLEEYWKIINQRFKPDIVHIHGTEFAHGLAFQNACQNVKTIVSIQGMISRISEEYYANIPINEVIKNITLRDLIKFDTLIHQKCKFKQRGKNEIQSIKKSNAIIGRTSWDYANVMKLCNEKKYYNGNEILRQVFYHANWEIKNIERHSMFMSQASYPIKGLHIMLEAISIIKEKYSDVILYIAGLDITNRGIYTSGYGKYIKKIIHKLKLESNVVFTGLLTEEQMLQRLLRTNVFVLPSAIENSSNSLGEAMLLGMPCVATNTGGTMCLLEHRKEGLLYPFTESAMCAEYIKQFFLDDNLCIEYGSNARKAAMKRYSKAENTKNIVDIYETILDRGE